MFDLNTYKKEVKLKDGTKVLLRPMKAEDQDALYTFFKSVPREDARYLRDDVASRLIVEKWAKNLDYERTLPILALKNGTVIADATLNRRRFGWKWHLGTVRLFVHRDYRKVGLGQLMIEQIADIAFKLELEKLIAEVPDVNISAINAFTKAGFYRVATIPNLVKDRENRPLDVVVMIKDIRPARDETYEYDF
ncbi:MAG: GNAT family N-acetyltransferase [Deltaproteobacteria bacterium]|jgi:ribosomal protein S18 acetylase RimI-like enzyme|nr:GNAT family N-acetyltransferase [Deltaproteobacteria bacterium]MBW2490412.1 GNAT family N-acetyltransferase [Deltaproteobacteria bacterium]